MSPSDASTSGLIDVQGTPLYYESAGTGDALLLIHAGVADSRMWDDQFAAFATHYRVIRCDLRGFGRSHVPNTPFANHDDIAGLLDALGIERAHVVGISFGGRNAIDFALAYPERVDRLVLGVPSLSGNPPSPELLEFGDEEDALVEAGDLHAAADLNVRMWVDGPHRTPEQVSADVRQRVHTMQYDAFNVPLPDGFDVIPLAPRAAGRLAEIQAPTLVIAGDQDHGSVQTLAGRIASEVPNARAVIMAGVAHMLNMEQPDTFNRLVLDFLAE